MTPLELQILLWIYARPTKPPAELCNSKAANETTDAFLRSGLIEVLDGDHGQDDWGWKTTPMANAYIEHIMQLPLPEQRWVMPE